MSSKRVDFFGQSHAELLRFKVGERGVVDVLTFVWGLLVKLSTHSSLLPHTKNTHSIKSRPPFPPSSHRSSRLLPPTLNLFRYNLVSTCSSFNLAVYCCATNNDTSFPTSFAMSSLKDVYDRFVTQPRVSDLYDDATLTFISSGTNIKGANEVVQYILRSRNDVEIIENVLTYHSGPTSLTVEVAAEYKFKNGPSWIVPGVDGNMLDGMVIKLPLVSAKYRVFEVLTRE